MAGLPGIIIQIGANTQGAIAGIQRINSELGKGLTGAQKFRASVDKALVPAGLALGTLVAAGADFAKQAAEDATAAATLATALKNTTGATNAQIAATEDWITAQGQLLGISDSDLRPALASLANATGDVAKAQELASLAMDVATQTGKPLETVSAALAKAYAGNTSSLGRLFPALDQNALKAKDFAAIQAELTQKTEGAALAAANAEGSTKRNAVALAEAQEEIGKRLLPVLAKFNEYLANTLKFVSENTTLVLVLAGVVGGLAAAVYAAKAALVVYDTYQKVHELITARATASQWALNASFLANPVFLVVAAIVALIAAFVLLYKNNEDFRRIVDETWQKIKDAVLSVIDWFRQAIPKAIDFIVNAFKNWSLLGVIITNWDKIKDFFTNAIDFFKEIGANIVNGIKNGIAGAWNSLTSFLTDKVDSLVGGVQDLLGIASPSKVFEGIGKQMVAGLDKGLAGLDQTAQAVNGAFTQMASPQLTAQVGFTGGTSTGGYDNISDERLARAVASLLLQSDLRNGRVVAAL